MDVASSLQKVIFAVAESQSLDAVLQMIVRGGERSLTRGSRSSLKFRLG